MKQIQRARWDPREDMANLQVRDQPARVQETRPPDNRNAVTGKAMGLKPGKARAALLSGMKGR